MMNMKEIQQRLFRMKNSRIGKKILVINAYGVWSIGLKNITGLLLIIYLLFLGLFDLQKFWYWIEKKKLCKYNRIK
jgi:hypothetical protein